ncbi:MAG: T9SS type A sorting domain-containing protein [Lentimicrobiaceae bacterium]|nr:T9SS type A sorting domain-containing protein [Lentimicrobiaceae bacterium]
MKQILFLLLSAFCLLPLNTFAQDRMVARGAESGELYLSNTWYGIYDPFWGPPFYDTVRLALYRFTENGKKMTIQYSSNYFENPEYTMHPTYILADATPGVIYNKCFSYDYEWDVSTTQLWTSFDYGKNWVFREEDMGSKSYSAVNVEGIIFRFGTDGAYKSEDYGNNFTKTEIKGIGSDPGLQYGEGFGIGGYNPYLYNLSHTYNFYETYIQIPIDSQYVFGQIGGSFPDVYRGGKEGEVYIDSWFPNFIYKVSFSADTGHTFRHIHIADHSNDNCISFFMSDREPGVFYIFCMREIPTTEGWYMQVCVDYYRDYGETLEATFCHDITKDYVYEEVACNNKTSLISKIENQNSVQLQWSSSAESALIRGYHVYRNNIRITSELLTDTIYVDANLPNGEYEYFVKTYYKEGCISDSSNHVAETIELSIGELGITNYKLGVYPNPTSGELRIRNYELGITGIEVFDVYGRKLTSHSSPLTSHSSPLINISHLPAGLYFVKITTEFGNVVKKVVKY